MSTAFFHDLQDTIEKSRNPPTHAYALADEIAGYKAKRWGSPRWRDTSPGVRQRDSASQSIDDLMFALVNVCDPHFDTRHRAADRSAPARANFPAKLRKIPCSQGILQRQASASRPKLRKEDLLELHCAQGCTNLGRRWLTRRAGAGI
jgi:hypothetical protein